MLVKNISIYDHMEYTENKYNLQYLERQVEHLTKLVNINSIINSTLDIGKLLTIVMEMIKGIMETETSTLLLWDEQSKNLVFKVALGEAGEELVEKYRVLIGQGIAGWVAEQRKPVIVNDVYADKRFDPLYDRETGFVTKAMICMPLLFKGKLLGVIQAINPLNRPGFDEDDLSLFKVFAGSAALAVQNAIFFQNAIEEERIKGEISSAKSIQESLIPNMDTVHGRIEISARTLPAGEVGGEFYGIYDNGKKGISIAMGDIMMKGLPGALNASIISGALKVLVPFRAGDPSGIVSYIRSMASNEYKNMGNISIFYCELDPETLELSFVNSGAAYPVILRNGKAMYLRMSSSGQTHNSREIKIRLEPGDSFIVLADGILNLRNRSGIKTGMKRIMAVIEQGYLSSRDMVDSILMFADDFSEGLERREDISMIAIMVK